MLHRVLVTTILLLVVSTPLAWGDAPYHAWSTSFGGTASDRVGAIDTDGYGNVYVWGYFQNTMDLGGGPLVSAGGYDMYLAKFAPDGSLIWSERFGGTGSEYALDMEVDDYGFATVIGRFSGTVDFGGGPLPNAGGYDIVVARYDPNGTHVWSQSIGSAGPDYASGVGISPDGFTYIVGQFSATITIGPYVFVPVGATDILLAKFSVSGNLEWGLSFGSTNNEYVQDVVVDGDGNVTLAAYGYASLDFGGGLLPNIGNLDVYLAQFDAGGNHRWSRVDGGASSDDVQSLAVDSGNNVVTAGYFTGTSDFGGGNMTANSWDAYVAKYDQNGNHVMSFRQGGPQTQYGFEVAVDDADNIYIAGQYIYAGNMGGDPFPYLGSYDAYIASYDPTGAHRWSRPFGGMGSDNAMGVAVGPFGNVYMGGDFYYGIDLGGGLMLSNGTSDVFVARFCGGPAIHSVLDIPGDQGGLVNVAWDRNTLDNTTDVAIGEYTVWRAIDAATAAVLIEKGAALIKSPAGFANAAPGQDVLRKSGGYYWYEAATVNANRLENYSAPVATLFDSTGAGTQYHYYQVIAHTADPAVFYTSNVDSGYSVDDLAPAAPQNLAAKQVAPTELSLTWDPNPEPDVSHYAVYRGTDPGFTADGGNLLGTTSEPTVLDAGWQWDGGYWYKVFAVDTHGNTSPYALIGPDLVTGAGDSPAVSRLEQNVPNPFNPSTAISFTLREAGEVTLAVYDATGRRVRTLVSGRRGAQRHEVTWDGRDDAGVQVASGVYFYRLTAGSFTQTKKMVLLK